eukprot:g13496.t1
MVFLRASDLFKLDPKWATATVREQAEALKKDPELLQRVERPLVRLGVTCSKNCHTGRFCYFADCTCIRGVAAVQMGIVKRWQDAERDSPYTPFVAAISPPANQEPFAAGPSRFALQEPVAF